MRRWALIALCAAFALSAVPARAADEKTLNCVVEHLDPANREMLERWGAGTIAGESMPTDFIRTIMREVVLPCAKEHEWSVAATTAATHFLLGQVGLPAAELELRARGVNVERVAGLYRAWPAAIRETSLQNLPKGYLDKLAETGIAAGYFQPDQARDVGRYIGLLNLLEMSVIEFRRA